MGLLSRISKAPSGTAIDFVEDEKASSPLDLERKGDEIEATEQHHSPRVLPDIERRVIRKMDMRIVPLVTALYVLAFLDRSNIGNARIAGMSNDLHLVGNDYQWLLTIFYITYIIFEFQTLMWKIVPPHMWLAFVVLSWGTVATAQASTHTWSGMMACRFFLGWAEAGFGPGAFCFLFNPSVPELELPMSLITCLHLASPLDFVAKCTMFSDLSEKADTEIIPGIPYLLSFFYLRHEVGVRIAVFLSAAPLATTFSGALAYGITSGHSHLPNWRLLFLVEGLPTICMAPVAYFFLPDTPDKARFFTEEEKAIAKARGVRQVGGVRRVGGIAWKEIGAALLDLKCWFTAFMYFSCNVSGILTLTQVVWRFTRHVSNFLRLQTTYLTQILSSEREKLTSKSCRWDSRPCQSSYLQY